MTAADGEINSLTYGCAIDRAARGGDHTALICHTGSTIKGKLSHVITFFFHFSVNAWSVVSGETNSCHREPETRHVKESKEECQERRINQQ